MITTAHVKRLLGIFTIAFVGLFGALTFGGGASAHHPVLSATTERPCDPEAPWSATVTAVSDRDRDKTWRNRYRVGSDAWSDWSATVEDEVPFVFDVGPFPASRASADVTVSSEWFGGPDVVKASRTIVIARPDVPDDCDQTVTPVRPSAGYDCRDGEIDVDFTDTDAYTYSVVIDDPADGEGDTWAVTITATAKPGYEFAPDAKTVWEFGGTVDCLDEVTPVRPSAGYDCRDGEIDVDFTDTDAYTYKVVVDDPADGEGDTWAITITATAKPGHEFAPDAKTVWEFSGTVDCLDEVTPVAPSAGYDCQAGEIVTNFTDTDAYTYGVVIDDPADGEGDTWAITITATAKPGYEFAADATTSWEFSGTVDCLETVTPLAPTADYDCVAGDIVTVFTDTDGYTYTVVVDDPADGEGDTWAITITATAQPGYEFAPDATTSWKFSGTVDCLETVTPLAPTADYDCEDGRIVTEFTSTDGYVYSVVIDDPADGEGDTWAITITATAQPGFEFAPDATTSWKFSGTVECVQQGAVTTTTTTTTTTVAPASTTTTTLRVTTTTKPKQLARTGSNSTSILLAYASLMTLGGGALMLVRRLPRRVD